MYSLLFTLLSLFYSPYSHLSSSEEDEDVVILGDSNTWLGGDDCTKPKGWNTWFKEAMKPRSCRSYARSGATWTHTPNTRRDTKEDIGRLGDNNVIMNQICRLEEAMNDGSQVKPSLILIAAGTNDVWFQDQRPHAFEPSEFSLESLQGIIYYSCCRLFRLCPEAKIILITPMETIKADTTDILRAGDIIEACGQYLDVPVIRLDRYSKVKSQNEQQAFKYTYDGTHTSELGARSNGTYIADRVRDIIGNK
jgi:lysophospholipase L1-like esterase